KGSYPLTNIGGGSFWAAKFNNGAVTGDGNHTKYLLNSTKLGITGDGPFTISLWAKRHSEITARTGEEVIFVIRVDLNSDQFYQLSYIYNGGTYLLQVNASNNFTKGYFTLGTSFHHLAVTHASDGTITLYADGFPAGPTGKTGASGGTGQNFFQLFATD